MGYVWTGGKNGNKLLSCQRKTDSCGRGIEEKEESIVSVHIQSIKMKYVYNYCVQRCDIYAPIPSICNQSIPTDVNLSIDCYWELIPIDNHTNVSHRWVIDYPYQSINWYRLALIDIDCHRLSILLIVYPGIVWHMTSFVQKIHVDSNHQEFVMKQTCTKDLVAIATFGLIGVLPTNHIISYFTMAYQSLWGNLLMLTVK